MEICNIHFYRDYLNKLVDECNISQHRSISKRPIHDDYSTFSEETVSNNKAPKFKFASRVSITNFNSIFSKG